MKKVLFATTALVASAGIASAQGVELSGFAEMGVIGGSGIETQFHSDIDVTFSLSGETDNGLTFGATIDLDEVGDDSTCAYNAAGAIINTPGTAGACGGDPISHTSGEQSVFISGSFGTLTMGDTDGAFDWAMQEVGIGSALTDDHTTHAGFSGNSGLDGSHDGQVARYDYSFGDFAFAVSAELDDTGADDPIFGIGGKYSGDLGGVTLGVGVGYQTGEVGGLDADIYGISLDATMDNGLRAILNYSAAEVGGVEGDHIGIGLGYTMDALTVSANYGVISIDTAGVANSEGFGFAANYDLGGGAVVQFGYGSGKVDDGTGTNTQTGSTDTWSLGVAMSF